jgi:putative ABC transport system permease protein
MRRLAHIPVVATLTVAVAFNVVSSSVLTALLERPFPFPDLGRLVLVRDARPTDGAHQGRAIAPGDFLDLRSSITGFSALSAYRATPLVITSTGADPERVEAIAVTADFFSTLGVTPAIGAPWPRDVDRPGDDRVVVISHRLWQARFGNDPSVVGRGVAINGRAATVTGIIRDEDCYPSGIDAWVPLVLSPEDLVERSAQRLNAVARLRPDITIDVARGQIDGVARRLALEFPVTNQGRGFTLLPLRREQYELTAPLFGLVAAGGLLVLFLGILNVTTVLAARQLDRAHEFATRAMLGASRGHLGWLVLRETTVLVAIAAFVGTAMSFPALNALRSSLPEGIARWVNGWTAMHVDSRGLLTAIVVAVTMATVIGGVLALYVPMSTAGAASGSRVTRRGRIGRRAIMTAQIGLAAALMVCEVAVFQTVRAQRAVFDRFAPARVLRFTLTLPSTRYPDDASIARFHTRLLDSLGAVPEIESAGIIRNEPASNVPSPLVTFDRLNAPARSANDRPRIDLQIVSERTLDVLRIPIVDGRPFLSTDTTGAPRVALVSRSAADRFWPDQHPIGALVRVGDDPSPIRIIGITDDVELNWYDGGSRPTMYVPDAQTPAGAASVVVRTRVDPLAVASQVRTALAGIDSAQPIGELVPLAASVGESLSPFTVVNRVLVAGSLVAVLLAAVGVFGLLAQAVGQRRREFGIRYAVGATTLSLAAIILRDALTTSAIGLAFAVPLALQTVRIAGSALVGLIAISAGGVTAVVGGTVVLAVLAALTPALRAARVDVGTLLRQ